MALPENCNNEIMTASPILKNGMISEIKTQKSSTFQDEDEGKITSETTYSDLIVPLLKKFIFRLKKNNFSKKFASLQNKHFNFINDKVNYINEKGEAKNRRSEVEFLLNPFFLYIFRPFYRFEV